MDILIFDELSRTLYEGKELKDGKNGGALQYSVPAFFTPNDLDMLANAILGRVDELNRLKNYTSPLMREALASEKKTLIDLHSKICRAL